MQITYKDVTIEMSPQEFDDIIALGKLDHLISLILSLEIPLDAVVSQLISEDSAGNLFGNFENIDEERISNLYRSLGGLDTDDDGF